MAQSSNGLLVLSFNYIANNQIAYLFTPARYGPRAATAILKERQEGRTITYTIQLDFPHMETGELLKTVVMDYTFALTITAEGYTLCILSATEQ